MKDTEAGGVVVAAMVMWDLHEEHEPRYLCTSPGAVYGTEQGRPVTLR